MSLERQIRSNAASPENPEQSKGLAKSLLEMMMRELKTDLEAIDGPSAADLEALDELDDNEVPLHIPLQPPVAPSQLPKLLPTPEEPEMVSLERLDDVEDISVLETLDEEILEEDDFLDELLEDHIDVGLDDDDLDDEGYDLDDDDIVHFQDLYGEDDSIIPSFREGELDDEDESGIAFYNDLR